MNFYEHMLNLRGRPKYVLLVSTLPNGNIAAVFMFRVIGMEAFGLAANDPEAP